MLTSEFDYHLPAASIAQRPLGRGESRLLVLAAAGHQRHRMIRDLPDLLRPGDLLVVNNTRVIPARLFGRRRPGGGRVELLLAQRLAPREWEVLLRPARRARPGVVIEIDDHLSAEVIALGQGGKRRLRFSEEIEPHLERLGHMPLPPYIRRDDDVADRERYQTIFARHPGAIAAPTAGLHFTTELLAQLAEAGVRTAQITLHVGIGTFKPVTAEVIDEHRLDAESFSIPEETAAAVRRARAGGGRVVAVGTTVVRTLESAIQDDGELRTGPGRTELFIHPGFRFRAVDGLLTNFHLPRSTLLMLVCAFAGRDAVLSAYAEAIGGGYRFYSYGDAMLAGPLT